MVDILTRRRLIIFLFAVLFVILSLLFFGRIIPSYSKYSSKIKTEDQQEINECYLTEPADVLTLCQKCTSYERRVKSKACLPTGYKETVLCSKSNIQTVRSCQVPISIQRQNFWLFEGCTLVIGILAIFTVQSRQKTLDKQMVEKIKRQIGENDE
jgi:capsular polysaccharide biosynthesis protein